MGCEVAHQHMARLKVAGNRLATGDARRVRVPPKVADDIYSTPEYAAWRKIVIERSGGYCQDDECETPHRKPSRLFADHIVELRDGGAPFDPANGKARCGSCHTRKTLLERAKRSLA